LDVWIDNRPLALALRKGASQIKPVHDVIEQLFRGSSLNTFHC
jgi:hypothetical protein